MATKAQQKRRADRIGSERGNFERNKKLLRKTSEVCALCGRIIDKSLKFPDPFSFSVDHIIPVDKGGRSSLDNLQAVHLLCNQQKNNKVLCLTNKSYKNLHENSFHSSELNSFPQFFDWSNYISEE